MSLVKFTRFSDGTPLSVDQDRVVVVEANKGGAGTTLWVEVGDRGIEVHVSEGYDEVIEELEMSPITRAARAFIAEAGGAAKP